MSDKLTRREVQCVRLAGQSLSNKEIAAKLNLSPSTVNNHLSRAYAKLGTSNRHTASSLVARDYPDFSRFQPIPIADVAAAPQVAVRPGDDAGPQTGDLLSTWPLPPPPRDRIGRITTILILAVVAAVITIGLVAIVEASMASFSAIAPPNALQAPPRGSTRSER